MHKDDDKVCVWMSIGERKRYNEWLAEEKKRTSGPTVEELIKKVRGVFTIVQRNTDYAEGLTELGCSLETAYRKERSFFEEECRKAGLIIDNLRRQLRDSIEELDARK